MKKGLNENKSLEIYVSMYLFVIFPDNEKFHVKAAVEMAVLVLHLDTYFGPCRTSIAELFSKLINEPRRIEVLQHVSYACLVLSFLNITHMSNVPSKNVSFHT